MKERNTLAKGQVKQIADDIETTLAALVKAPTHENLIALNGLWSRAYRYVAQGTSDAPTTGGSGLKEGARLAA